MVQLNNIYLKYGDRVLLNHVSLLISPRDKIGLIGRNGAGKSTLFAILTDEIRPDEGNIQIQKGVDVGILKQVLNVPKDKSVIEYTLEVFSNIKAFEKEIEAINAELLVREDYESDSYQKMIDRLSEITEHLQILENAQKEGEAEKVLKGLGFKQHELDGLVTTLSGGWKMRVELAKLLLQKPQVLLLDEPTNHLDIESIIWLESYLQNYPGAVIVISHDQAFLDAVSKRIIEVELGRIYDYKGTYSEYLVQKVERQELMENAYKNQQKVIAQKERTITRFMAKASKTKMAQSMKNQLDKLERIELVGSDDKGMNITFPPAPRSGVIVAEAKNVSKSFGENHVLNSINLKIDRHDKVAFVGQNGQGKSTLAKMLMDQLDTSNGECILGHNVEIAYYAQNQTELFDRNKTLLQTIEDIIPEEIRTKARSILGAFMFSGEDAEKKVSVLSGGEKARLALACMLTRPANLLVLDEPTHHLDIISKNILKEAIIKYDGTLLVVSHDRSFLDGLTSKTYEFRDQKIHEYLGDVNEFLSKRAMDSFREVEMRTKNKSATIEEKPHQLDREEEKKQKRVIQNAERKIAKCEEKIAAIEIKMSDPTFFEQADKDKILADYKSLKNQLSEQMEQWEKAVELLG